MVFHFSLGPATQDHKPFRSTTRKEASALSDWALAAPSHIRHLLRLWALLYCRQQDALCLASPNPVSSCLLDCVSWEEMAPFLPLPAWSPQCFKATKPSFCVLSQEWVHFFLGKVISALCWLYFYNSLVSEVIFYEFFFKKTTFKVLFCFLVISGKADKKNFSVKSPMIKLFYF